MDFGGHELVEQRNCAAKRLEPNGTTQWYSEAWLNRAIK
jgi:hypothetical protein